MNLYTAFFACRNNNDPQDNVIGNYLDAADTNAQDM